MKQGGWIPVDKNLRHYLPKGRAYSLIEAYLSYRIDLDDGVASAVNDYARRWGWSRNKVRNFIGALQEGAVEVEGALLLLIPDRYIQRVNPTPHRLRRRAIYRQWREAVLERDGYACVKCGGAENLHAHHIKRFAIHERHRLDVDNGMTLCRECHKDEHRKN